MRGSVPLFWTQKSKSAKVSLKDSLLTEQAFDSHITSLVQQYGLVVFLNLLSKEKPPEQVLSTRLDDLFSKFAYQRCKKCHYDFHYQTQGDNFANLDTLIEKVKHNLLNTFGFWIENQTL